MKLFEKDDITVSCNFSGYTQRITHSCIKSFLTASERKNWTKNGKKLDFRTETIAAQATCPSLTRHKSKLAGDCCVQTFLRGSVGKTHLIRFKNETPSNFCGVACTGTYNMCTAMRVQFVPFRLPIIAEKVLYAFNKLTRCHLYNKKMTYVFCVNPQRRLQRSCERENENRQQKKRRKNVNLPRVRQATISDAAATHQPVQQGVHQSRPLYQSSPLSEHCCNFRSDRFGDDLTEPSSVVAKFDQILRNQRVMISTMSQLIVWIRALRASNEKM